MVHLQESIVCFKSFLFFNKFVLVLGIEGRGVSQLLYREEAASIAVRSSRFVVRSANVLRAMLVDARPFVGK